MKKITIKLWSTMLVILLTIQFSMAQWEEVYTGTGMFMRDICFVPGTDNLWKTGWAISYEGDIIKTTDGGDNWTEISQTISTQLAGISFADETTGYIATLDNKIIKSNDGGSTWTTVYDGSVNFDKIAMKDAQNGVASGTQKLYTDDGGTTWTTGTGGLSYWDLDYGSGDTYYGVNLAGSLGYSTDGGDSWSALASLGVFCMMVDFMDDTHGMFGGDLSTIKVTHDGGDTWTENTLGGGQDAINCGGFFDMDTLYAAGSSGDIFKSDDGGENWVTDTSFASGVFQPRGLVVTGMNVVFATGRNTSDEGKIWRKVGDPPLDADFEADPTTVCMGSTVDFIDTSYGVIDSWTWTFEGGTPSTSTDQNPTVTYNSTGNFNVTLEVTIGSLTDTEVKTDYIEVVSLPVQADAPMGDTEVCTGMFYIYSTNEVEFGHEYEWEVDPSTAGTIVWEDTEATFTVADDFTGDFTMKVRAANVCGDGEWSDNLEGTVYQSPEEFILEGGGSYCLGGEGVEITLDGSQTGISYELYLDAESTEVIVDGTGSEISFGMFTSEGYYTAIGSNDNCELNMSDQVSVLIDFPPVEPSTPQGPETVCNDSISEYDSDGSEDADTYTWVLTPENAGTIVADGLEATITWDIDFTGTAEVALYGINDCGEGNISLALEVNVDAIPAPEISGQNLVCDNQVEIYEVTENDGSLYLWEVSGGTISEGDSTFSVTVEWGEVGTGTLTVSETTANGCEGSSESFEVVIDGCTAINDEVDEESVQIYPNPAKDYVVIKSAEHVNSIDVYSMNGEKVLTQSKSNEQIRLNTSGLNSGMYLIRLVTESSTITKTLIIK